MRPRMQLSSAGSAHLNSIRFIRNLHLSNQSDHISHTGKTIPLLYHLIIVQVLVAAAGIVGLCVCVSAALCFFDGLKQLF